MHTADVAVTCWLAVLSLVSWTRGALGFVLHYNFHHFIFVIGGIYCYNQRKYVPAYYLEQKSTLGPFAHTDPAGHAQGHVYPSSRASLGSEVPGGFQIRQGDAEGSECEVMPGWGAAVYTVAGEKHREGEQVRDRERAAGNGAVSLLLRDKQADRGNFQCFRNPGLLDSENGKRYHLI